MAKRKRKKEESRARRQGSVTQAERDLVSAFVLDQPGPITPKQERALTAALRRTPETVKGLIEDARLEFAGHAGRYVEVHAKAVDDALASGTVTGLDTAIRGSQWAIEKISSDGARVVDKAAGGESGGTKILIGIQVGGVDAPATAITIPVVKE